MNSILDAPVATEQKLEYAGFWIRFVAALIDGIILGVVNMVLSFALIGGGMGMSMAASDGDIGSFGMMFAVYYIIVIGVQVAYYALMESSARQATLGKMAVGIKVGNEQGGRISAMNAVGRYFAKIISTLILLIGYIMAAFDVRKQALHDKIASTVVFYSNQ